MNKHQKGQISETLGFVILAVAVIILISISLVYFANSFGMGFINTAEQHETQGFKAGVDSVLQSTEPKTGKKMMELLGTIAYLGKEDIYFGPEIGTVNVLDEIKWRFDKLYGHGHWYMKIPFPDFSPNIQIVTVVDTSPSLCDDVKDMRDNLPKVVKELRDDGLDVTATVFMLSGGARCCGKEKYTLRCEEVFPETDYFHCRNIDQASCSTKPRNNEDWGRGLKCAIESGPVEGWKKRFYIRVGMVMSDELSGSSDDACTPGGMEQSLDTAIDAATNFGMYVFPLKANPCGCVCVAVMYNKRLYEYNICSGKNCSECAMGKDVCDCSVKGADICKCSDQLDADMGALASATGGKVYNLDNATEVYESLKEIFRSLISKIKPYLEAGTTPPKNKNIKAMTVPLPVVLSGEYTKIYVYKW
ncbi:MAG: hypothetical protein DRI92_05605 [Aquificota bacterium]|nr:MAG: hypothetical protein DRI92_05605 [Aquificota bacterium]